MWLVCGLCKMTVHSKPKEDFPNACRNWCFSINNWTSNDVDELSQLHLDPGGPDFMVIGREVGEKTGTPHLQCFAHWSYKRTGPGKSGQRFSWLRKRLSRAGKIDKMYSSVSACMAYCKKDGDYDTYGKEPRGQGKGKLDEVKVMIQNGCTEKEVADEHFGLWCRYHKAFGRFRALCAGERRFKTKVTWIHGGTNQKMLKYAYGLHDDLKRMYKYGRFWSEYRGDAHVLWQNFDDKWMDMELYDDLTGEFPCKIEQKGGEASFMPLEIIIISKYGPGMCKVNTLVNLE